MTKKTNQALEARKGHIRYEVGRAIWSALDHEDGFGFERRIHLGYSTEDDREILCAYAFGDRIDYRCSVAIDMRALECDRSDAAIDQEVERISTALLLGSL